MVQGERAPPVARELAGARARRLRGGDVGSPSIDVVIPTYNGWELTRSCLEHLRLQTVPHTTIVVDNASLDDTADRIRAEHGEVRLVGLGANLGFAAACNRGAAAGTADVVVLLNNDVEVRPNFLEELVTPLLDADIGSVAALLVRPDGRTIDSVGLAADRTLAGFPRLAGRPVAEAAAERPLLVGPSGGAGAYRRRVWHDAGGLDERMFMYMEDLDLALRLRAAGWGTAAAPTAVGVHLGSATIGSGSAWTRYNGGWARGYLLRRYGVLRSTAAFRALATEAAVVVGHLARSRDASALRGRIAGWRAAGEEPPRRPPTAGIDDSIGFVESLRLRLPA